MTITELMQRFIVEVDSSDEADKLGRFIRKVEPHFKSNGYVYGAGFGYYYCDNDGYLHYKNHY